MRWTLPACWARAAADLARRPPVTAAARKVRRSITGSPHLPGRPRPRHRDAERLDGSEVDHQLELRRLLHEKVQCGSTIQQPRRTQETDTGEAVASLLPPGFPGAPTL